MLSRTQPRSSAVTWTHCDQFGNWTIEVDSNNNLLFKYSNNTKIRMTSAGALDVEDALHSRGSSHDSPKLRCCITV